MNNSSCFKLQSFTIVDQDKIQCNSTEAMDKIIITKNCLIETNPEFKALIERKEAQEVCELEVKGIDRKRMWSDSFNRNRALDDCVEPKWQKQNASQQIWDINLSKKCTGFI